MSTFARYMKPLGPISTHPYIQPDAEICDEMNFTTDLLPYCPLISFATVLPLLAATALDACHVYAEYFARGSSPAVAALKFHCNMMEAYPDRRWNRVTVLTVYLLLLMVFSVVIQATIPTPIALWLQTFAPCIGLPFAIILVSEGMA